MGETGPGQSAAWTGCGHLPPTSTLCGGLALWGQVGGTLMLSVEVHWVHWPWGLLDGAGQGQPPPVFCLGPRCLVIKQSEVAATCGGLGDSQVKPIYESRLAVASAWPVAY